MDTNVLSSGRDILSLVIFAFLCILAILWILVPFAIFGVKSLLHSLIAEQRRTNQALEALSEQLQASALRPVVLHDPAPGPRVIDTGPTPG
jgi:predicted PurR-regulated permease PerM